MEGETKELIIMMLIPIFMITLLLLPVSALMYYDDPQGTSFCIRQGHQGVSFFDNGVYSEYYGKISCKSSFKNESITQTYEVERKFGRFFVK